MNNNGIIFSKFNLNLLINLKYVACNLSLFLPSNLILQIFILQHFTVSFGQNMNTSTPQIFSTDEWFRNNQRRFNQSDVSRAEWFR